jgi:hypothetical protein
MQIPLSAPDATEGTQRRQINLPAPVSKKTFTKIQLVPATRSALSPKKPQNVSGSFKRKKHKRQSLSPLRQIEDLPIWDVSAPYSDVDSTGDGTVSMNPFDMYDSSPTPGTPPPQLYELQSTGAMLNESCTDATNFDSSFAIYVDTMASRAVSIIQICETLFVAQGWNARFNSGTVRGS